MNIDKLLNTELVGGEELRIEEPRHTKKDEYEQDNIDSQLFADISHYAVQQHIQEHPHFGKTPYIEGHVIPAEVRRFQQSFLNEQDDIDFQLFADISHHTLPHLTYRALVVELAEIQWSDQNFTNPEHMLALYQKASNHIVSIVKWYNVQARFEGSQDEWTEKLFEILEHSWEYGLKRISNAILFRRDSPTTSSFMVRLAKIGRTTMDQLLQIFPDWSDNTLYVATWLSIILQYDSFIVKEAGLDSPSWRMKAERHCHNWIAIEPDIGTFYFVLGYCVSHPLWKLFYYRKALCVRRTSPFAKPFLEEVVGPSEMKQAAIELLSNGLEPIMLSLVALCNICTMDLSSTTRTDQDDCSSHDREAQIFSASIFNLVITRAGPSTLPFAIASLLFMRYAVGKKPFRHLLDAVQWPMLAKYLDHIHKTCPSLNRKSSFPQGFVPLSEDWLMRGLGWYEDTIGLHNHFNDSSSGHEDCAANFVQRKWRVLDNGLELIQACGKANLLTLLTRAKLG